MNDERNKKKRETISYIDLISGVTRGGLARASPGHREKNKSIIDIKLFIVFTSDSK